MYTQIYQFLLELQKKKTDFLLYFLTKFHYMKRTYHGVLGKILLGILALLNLCLGLLQDK